MHNLKYGILIYRLLKSYTFRNRLVVFIYDIQLSSSVYWQNLSKKKSFNFVFKLVVKRIYLFDKPTHNIDIWLVGIMHI